MPTETEWLVKLEAAERDRDDLLRAAGFKPGALSDDLTRKVVLDDIAGMRPAMVAARKDADQAQSDAWLWQMLMFDDENRVKLGSLLPRVWQRAKDAEAALAEARKVIEPFAEQAATHSPKMPDQMFIDDYERAEGTTWTSFANITIGQLRAARDWRDRNPESSDG